jgi:hypothetical protein
VETAIQEGVAMGAAWNAASEDAARVFAMQQCLDSKTTPVKARAMCRVVNTFSRQCVSIVADQHPRGVGWGWAVHPDISVAESTAQRQCAAQSCVTTVAGCDSSP